MNAPDLLATLGEILALLVWIANHDPIYASEAGGDLHCFYCGEFFVVSRPKETEHQATCIWRRARALVEAS